MARIAAPSYVNPSGEVAASAIVSVIQPINVIVMTSVVAAMPLSGTTESTVGYATTG